MLFASFFAARCSRDGLRLEAEDTMDCAAFNSYQETRFTLLATCFSPHFRSEYFFIPVIWGIMRVMK
jgi:hypothetical protein